MCGRRGWYTRATPVRLFASIGASWLILASGSVLSTTPTPSASASRAPAPLTCTLVGLPGNAFTFVRKPDPSLRQFLTGDAGTATFQVTYVGFESFPAAQAAFQAAVDIWSELVDSPVPIKVRAEFKPLGTNILGSAGGQFFWRDFPGAPMANTWYIDAIADRAAGQDVNAANPGHYDILASFNSTYGNWFFGTSGATPAGQYDFLSVVLHELGHGLGVNGAASVSGGVGSIGFSNFPSTYERFAVTELDAPLLGFANPSTFLGTQLTSGYVPSNPRGPGVYWGGPLARLANSGLSARLYTPSTWSAGSSYSHLDESTYPAGNQNSLMTYAIAQAEAIHSPGPVTMGLLGDSGWVSPGSLVKTAADPTVYWLQNTRRYAISSPSIITAMHDGAVPGWNASAIATVPALPGMAAPVFIAADASSNGLLIRPFASSTVFVVQNGLRRPIVSQEALAWDGVMWFPNVIDVAPSVLASYTSGLGLSVYSVGEGENPTVKQQFAAAYSRLMSAATCGTTTSAGWPGAFATCLEFPQSEVFTSPPSSVSQITSRFQNYGNGAVRLGLLQHSTLGTFGVWGPILDKWQELGGPTSALGLPISDEYQWGAGRRSDFEGGHITSVGGTVTVVFNTAVPTPFAKASPINGATEEQSSVTLSWATSSGATAYEYCLDATVNSSCDTGWVAVGAVTTANVSGLDLGSTYQWQVRALGNSGATFADNGAWWSFTTAGATRILSIIGNLSFGGTVVGHTSSQTIAIANTGNSPLTVTGISYPAGFSGNWSGGVIGPGGSHDVLVTFAPTAVASYSGTVTIAADQTSGTTTIDASGAGVLRQVTDLNGDGLGDLLLQNSSSTFIGAWLMNASGQPSSFEMVYPSDLQGWAVVGRADFNGDGVGDILIQNASSTFLGALLLNGSGQPASFAFVYQGNLDTWKAVGTLDVNGDGVADILLQDSVTTYVGAILMNAAGQPTSFLPIYFDNLNTWRVAGATDLNSDGIGDILLQNTASTFVGGLIMNSAGQVVSFVPVYFADAGAWRITGVEDLNGDGIADIVLQDSISTFVGAWLMNASGQPVTFTMFYPSAIGVWRVTGR